MTIEDRMCIQEDEVIEDLCDSWRLYLREFFHPTLIVPASVNSDESVGGGTEKMTASNYFDDHEPSGGDIPEDINAEEKAEGSTRQQDKPEKKNGTLRRTVDYGKIMALRKAGWTVRKIAEEMRMSEAGIYAAMRKVREEDKQNDEGNV